jgi:osmotically-inducible protein OsmY
MSDEKLGRDVNEELLWDPKVDPAAVAATADDGVVTLRGTVGSFRERREARKAAQRVYGVKRVDDQLEVRLLTESRREDADLRGAVLQALMLDSVVPSTVDAHVDGSVVTLTGGAWFQHQREEAEFVAGNVLGVVDVVDEIDLVAPPPDADGVRHSIKKAFKRNAKLDAKNVTVETSSGTVALSGVVSSWAEHDEAMTAAWAAPGVQHVEDRLVVEY